MLVYDKQDLSEMDSRRLVFFLDGDHPSSHGISSIVTWNAMSGRGESQVLTMPVGGIRLAYKQSTQMGNSALFSFFFFPPYVFLFFFGTPSTRLESYRHGKNRCPDGIHFISIPEDADGKKGLSREELDQSARCLVRSRFGKTKENLPKRSHALEKISLKNKTIRVNGGENN